MSQSQRTAQKQQATAAAVRRCQAEWGCQAGERGQAHSGPPDTPRELPRRQPAAEAG